MSPKSSRRDRGDGALYQRKDGLWVAAVELPIGADGKRRRKTLSSKDYATAVKKLRALHRQVEDSGGDIPTASTLTGKWLEIWVETIAAPRLRPNSLRQYRADIRLHIIPAVGRYRLDKLAPHHVRAMHTAILATHSSTSAMRCHALLFKALKDAMIEGLISRNVAELVDRPKKAANNRGYLTFDQARTLLRHVADQPGGARWAAALFTGARQGELLGLQRSRVTDVLDLSWQLQRLPYKHGCGGKCGKRPPYCPEKVLEVPPGFEYRVLEGPMALTRPKSTAGTRIVPLLPALATILDRHMAATDPGPHDLVWSADGHPIGARTDSRAWHEALAGAGLPPVPLHAARHTTATLLLETGVDSGVISSVLGHSSVLVTRGYQHVSQELTRRALAGFEERLALP